MMDSNISRLCEYYGQRICLDDVNTMDVDLTDAVNISAFSRFVFTHL